jgi:hypothetical protein
MKILIFILFLSTNLCLSQELRYNFDLIGSYKSDNFFGQGLINSENEDYYMSIRNRDSLIYGSLFDIKKKQIHSFELTKNNLEYKFKYLSTKKNNSLNGSLFVDFEINEKDSIINIKEYFNKKKKKEISHSKLLYSNSDKNYYKLFQICCLQHFSDRKEYFFNSKKVIILMGTVINRRGITEKFVLHEIEKVNLEIVIDKINK